MKFDGKTLYFTPWMTRVAAALQYLALIAAVLVPMGIPTVANGQTVFAGTFRAGTGASASQADGKSRTIRTSTATESGLWI